MYRKIQEETMVTPGTEPIHLSFEFAEKVLLPHRARQPGHLEFVTGLKFHFFGAPSSSQSRCFIFGLREGHWPNNKTANEVSSMLHYAF